MGIRRYGDQTNVYLGAVAKELGDPTRSCPNYYWTGDPEVIFGGSSFQTWPAANLAFYVPIIVTHPYTTANLALNGGNASSGNVDLGIYTKAGVRLVSTGSQAYTGGAGFHIYAISSTLLVPGVYYLALACDSTTPSITLRTWTVNAHNFLMNRQEASAFPLPANATFALVSNGKMPELIALP